MRIIPLHIKQANEFVKKFHRHNLPTVGGKFAIGCTVNNSLVGVAICGRPISRNLDNGFTLEIYRVCTNGYKNATSFIYSRCKRIGQLMGYSKIITYTLQSESGSSLKAIGAKKEKLLIGEFWRDSEKVKRKKQNVSKKSKVRWAI